jgi:hypothetical protein
MIALNCRARPVQLQNARQDLQRQHDCTPYSGEATIADVLRVYCNRSCGVLLSVQRGADGATPSSDWDRISDEYLGGWRSIVFSPPRLLRLMLLDSSNATQTAL